MTMSRILESVPRGLMAANNLAFSGLVFLKGWDETHVHNPHWPPHARFHSGQCMSFGAMASLTATYLLHRREPAGEAAERDSLLLAAIVGSLTTASGLTALLYPGSRWADPEWDNGKLMGPQGWFYLGQLVLNWALYLMERTRMAAAAAADKDKGAGEGAASPKAEKQ